MYTSQLSIPTLREDPSDVEVASHKLMLRAGLVRPLSSGLYTWLPLGLKVLRKIEAIIREEMGRVGAQEVLMPILQPSELWKETKRWDDYGHLLLKVNDRSQKSFCLGPTHEEVVTDLARKTIYSYKQLPIIFYQIQTKFRDEIRPRFGLMRAREFLMKDAYSFHLDASSLSETYQSMYQAYCSIFSRLSLNYRAVIADSGEIGGSISHEFHVLASAGEDIIAYSDDSDYAANLEKAEYLSDYTDDYKQTFAEDSPALELIHTPDIKSVSDLSAYVSLSSDKIVKTLLVRGQGEHPYVALLIRGDRILNMVKARSLPELGGNEIQFVTEEEIPQILGCPSGFLGPFNLSIPIIVDREVFLLQDFICGANKEDYHYKHVFWGRDLPFPSRVADLRNVEEGDLSPDGKGKLCLQRGIEVGHIFQLGDKYSSAMEMQVLDKSGKHVTPIMGCYGIGVSRLLAAIIEQLHDDKGIIWPCSVAPFQVIILPLNYYQSSQVAEVALQLYSQFLSSGIEVLFDDRKERPGVLFNDAELIGIPHIVVISDRTLSAGMTVEHRKRGKHDYKKNIKLSRIVQTIKNDLD